MAQYVVDGEGGAVKAFAHHQISQVTSVSAVADVASLSGGVAQYVVDGEDVAVKAGFLKKCALDAGALSR